MIKKIKEILRPGDLTDIIVYCVFYCLFLFIILGASGNILIYLLGR